MPAKKKAATKRKPHPKEALPVIHVKDITPDPLNARKHNPRNIGVIVDSLQQLGAGRSILLDENNQLIAGHGVTEAAAEAGLEKVRIVDAEGDEIIAVRRKNLTREQKVDMALRDNRAAELAEWDGPVLKGIAETLDVSHLFRENELAKLTAEKDDDDSDNRYPDMELRPDEQYNYVVLVFKSEASWDRAVDVLGIQTVVAQHGGISKTGLGRVLKGDDVIDKIVESE